MGNAQTQQNIGDFQQGAGKVTATLGVVSSYFGAFVLICLAILFVYLAFANLSLNSNGSNSVCSADSDCKVKGESCQSGRCSPPPGPAKKHPWFLLGTVFFIGLAIFTVYYARAVKEVADSSRTGAQFVGTMGEANLVRSIFR